MERLLTIEDVMEELGIGRKKATHLLNMKSCPKLPRKKGCKYLVPRQAFDEWVNGGFK